MWYKEWLSVRIKFFLILTIFGAVAILSCAAFAFNSSYNGFGNASTIFMRWVGISFLLAVGAGILGGVDIIAAEREQNTITFLLARPVSRFKIYASKLGINAVAFLVIFVPVNLLVLLVDNMTRQISVLQTTSVVGASGYIESVSTQTGTVAATITPGSVAIPLIIVGALLGVTVICITALTSIFATNIVHGFLLGVIGLTVSVVALNVIGTRVTGNYSVYNLTDAYNARDNILLLIVYSVIVFGAGAFMFRREEF
jgi:ABC-type transport system involved in multi-copper enzyme maturation permease subunit